MPRNTQSNRGGSNRSRSKNNNPEGYNQYNSGWIDSARERPLTAAMTAAAAVGASVFLWSRRSQISEQLNNLSDQIGEWSENMSARGGSEELETAGGESRFSGSSGSGALSSGTSGGGAFGSGASGSGTSSTGSGNQFSAGTPASAGSTDFASSGTSGSTGRRSGGKSGRVPG